MKKRKKGKEPDGMRWMLTYSDLITLLMIFFIVMYSMSQVDQNKYKQLSQSLKVAMGGGKTIIGTENAPSVKDNVNQIDIPERDDGQTTSQTEQQKFQNLKKEVDQYLSKNGMSKSVSTSVDQRGLVVSINDTLFFDTGKADIKPNIKNKLIGIGKIVNQLGSAIRIEGHTDNVPISNGIYKSNWQLSSVRAANVTQFLQDKVGISPEKLTSVGYGQYRAITDNSTDVNKAKNRRVDIIIENSKFNDIDSNTTNSQNNKK
ncbi:OmpA/MotB family protein [Clostridium tyrobutyricum]|uniref:OmpA/MotB family protein n=1 Tax=Clostridium tyrobutyricum TaxID=1519 RepID=UPI0011C92140|nr:flagellar motor protein MotB [Clostridium tyrobutyricum]